jgi:hypothetical protein
MSDETKKLKKRKSKMSEGEREHTAKAWLMPFMGFALRAVRHIREVTHRASEGGRRVTTNEADALFANIVGDLSP